MDRRLEELSDDDLARLRDEAAEALRHGHAEQSVRRYGIRDRSALQLQIAEIEQELERRRCRNETAGGVPNPRG